MLNCCAEFADQRWLTFNAAKTQLIRFSFSNFPCNDPAKFLFLGEKLVFSSNVVHLGHILSCSLSDGADITAKKLDLCRKANCMLIVFSSFDPLTKTRLFQSFCLSLYGAALWNTSSNELASLLTTL